MILPALQAGHPHPAFISYLCTTLGAMARRMGCDVPQWREEWLLDFHALAAPDPDEPEEEE